MTSPAAVAPRPRRFPWWIYWILLAVIVLFTVSPVIPLAIATTIAEQNGCILNEGSANPCVVGGKDIGGDLYAMGVMGWFFLATIPVGVFAFIAWVIVLIVHRVLWGRRREAA